MEAVTAKQGYNITHHPQRVIGLILVGTPDYVGGTSPLFKSLGRQMECDASACVKHWESLQGGAPPALLGTGRWDPAV